MNFLLIGKPGSGKTTAAAQACLANPPGILIDVDGKANDMVNIRPLIRDGIVDVIHIKDRLVNDRLSARALNPDKPPKTQPTGYVTTIDILNDIIDGEKEYEKYNIFILDSLTRLCEHLTRLLIYHRGQGKFGKKVDDDMNWPAWGSYKANLEEAFTLLCASDKTFICTAHEKTMTKTTTTMIGQQVVESEEIVGFRPLIEGQMREKLAGYFNECYYMEPKTMKGKPTQYRFRTVGSKYDARTSMDLPELVDADMEKILKKAMEA
jgi:hypothetical protein